MKNKKKNNKNKKKNIIGILVILLALGVIFIISFTVFGGNREKDSEELKVPKLKGMTIDQAKVALERVGLELVDAGSEISSEPKGNILDLDPAEGSKVEKGDSVRVVVSTGEDKIKMPDFKGAKLETVKAFFKKNGVTDVKYIEQYDLKITKGLVIKIDPAVDTEITSKSKATVYTSKGAEKKFVKVPNLIGYDSSKAKTSLEDLGLKVTIAYNEKITDKNKDAKVVAQSIVDKSIEVGQGVTLTIGKYAGPAKKSFDASVMLEKLRIGMERDGIDEVLRSRPTWVKINEDGEKNGAYLTEWEPKNPATLTEGENDTITLTFSRTNPNE